MVADKYISQDERAELEEMQNRWKMAVDERVESIQPSLHRLEHGLRAKGKNDAYITWRLKYATDRAKGKVNKMCMNTIFWPYFSKKINNILPKVVEDSFDRFVDVRKI